MMRQFEVIVINGGRKYLTAVDLTRHDFAIGFRRILKELQSNIGAS